MTNYRSAVRGVILAGGLGTRLEPMSRVVNKHLMDVYDRPMISYALDTMRASGIDDVVIVTTEDSFTAFRKVLGDVEDMRVRYVPHGDRPGVAGALASAEQELLGCRMLVLLGDTIFQQPLRNATESFLDGAYPAQVMLCPVLEHRVSAYGIATMDDGRVVDVVEKPRHSESVLAVAGCYWYDGSVFDRIRGLRPSARGELEISEVNALYAREGKLAHRRLSGWIADAGTPAGKLRAGLLVALEKGVALQL